MSATVAGAQVRTYLEGVEAHLDDLPDADRDELLEDLEEHLLEVAAEGDGTLEQRLGPPAVYAEELRASAGLPSREQLLARRPSQRIAERLARSGVWRSAIRFAESSQLGALRGFLKELQPGWWVLRGYLAVIALAILPADTGKDDIPFPAILDSRITGTAFVIIAILFSVWLGRRARWGQTRRRLSIILSVVVALAGIAALAPSNSTSYVVGGDVNYDRVPFLLHGDGNPIANICPYSADGKLLSGVLLFDQDGRPIVNTSDSLPDGRPLQASSPTIPNAYPKSLSMLENQVTLPPETTDPTKVTQMLTPLSCPASIGAPGKPAASAHPAPAPSPGG